MSNYENILRPGRFPTMADKLKIQQDRADRVQARKSARKAQHHKTARKFWGYFAMAFTFALGALIMLILCTLTGCLYLTGWL